jgi:hypothetical protein
MRVFSWAAPPRKVVLGLAGLALGMLSLCGSPAQAASGFSLNFSQELNTGGNPAPYTATASFSVVGNQLKIDVNNTSGTWIDTLGFNIAAGLPFTLDNYQLSGVGTAGTTVGPKPGGNNLSTFGNFEHIFTFGGANGGHLMAQNWTVTADIIGAVPADIAAKTNSDGKLGAVHFGPINTAPTLWASAGAGTTTSVTPEGPSGLLLAFGGLPLLGLLRLRLGASRR